MKIRYRVILLLILCSNRLFSQTAGVIVKDIKPAYEDNIFPEITYATNPKVSEKINISLQLEYLDHLPGVFKKHPFENVCYVADANRTYVSFYEWKKLKSPKNVLSLTISGEATGAYPEGFTNYHNFDLETGELIALQSLFNKAGQAQLANKLNLKVKKTIKVFLADLNTKTTDKEEIERNNEQQNIYEGCLAEINDNSLNSYEFHLGKDSITFIRYRCSNHANRALDDLDKFFITYPYKQVKQYLSAYGKRILTGDNGTVTLSSIKGKMFKGKIAGKYPVTAIITDIYTDGTITMRYWYDRVKIPIEWSGKFINGHFSLTEEADHLPDAAAVGIKANIEANLLNQKSITGTWTNVKTGAVLPFTLYVY